jgi:hypothetical protein
VANYQLMIDEYSIPVPWPILFSFIMPLVVMFQYQTLVLAFVVSTCFKVTSWLVNAFPHSHMLTYALTVSSTVLSCNVCRFCMEASSSRGQGLSRRAALKLIQSARRVWGPPVPLQIYTAWDIQTSYFWSTELMWTTVELSVRCTCT